MSASRVRLASSSGADFTSSRSCRIIPPIRITFAGCSTSSAMFRSPSPFPSPSLPSSDGAGPPAIAIPSGPMIITRGSSPSSGACSGFWDVMGPTLRSEHDLPDVVTGLHDPVPLGGLRQGQGGVHEGPHGAVSDQRPDVLDGGGADRRLLLDRPGAQRGGDHRAALAHQRAEVQLALGPALHAD